MERAARNLVGHFKKNPGLDLADAAYTLQVGRQSFSCRRMVVCAEVKEAIDLLSAPSSGECSHFEPGEEQPKVIFLFPGQGSQYVNMGKELYEKVPLFREEMNQCLEMLKPLLGYDLKEILYPGISLPEVGGGGPGDAGVTRRAGHEGDVGTPLTGFPRQGINRTEIAQPWVS